MPLYIYYSLHYATLGDEDEDEWGTAYETTSLLWFNPRQTAAAATSSLLNYSSDYYEVFY